MVIVVVIIIQGKDDTKLNKDMNGWSQTDRAENVLFFLLVRWSRCSVCPPYVNRHIKLTSELKV